MPRVYKPRPPRPATLIGECGHVVEVKATGALPRFCPDCRAARELASRAVAAVGRVDMAALPAADARALGNDLDRVAKRAARRAGVLR